MLLAGRELVNAAPYLLLTGGDAGGDPVEALPHRVEIEPHGIELPLIGGRGGRRDHLPGRVAVGLPSQSGGDTNEKRDQVAGEGERCQLAEPPPARRLVFFQVGRANGRCLGRWLDEQRGCDELGLLGTWHGIHFAPRSLLPIAQPLAPKAPQPGTGLRRNRRGPSAGGVWRNAPGPTSADRPKN